MSRCDGTFKIIVIFVKIDILGDLNSKRTKDCFKLLTGG